MNDSELLDFLREQYSLLHTDDDNVICDGVDRHWIPHHWKAFCAVGPKVPPSSMFMRKNSGSSNNRVLTNVVNSNNNALNKSESSNALNRKNKLAKFKKRNFSW